MLNDISQTETKPFSIGNSVKWPGNYTAKNIHAFFFLLFSCQVMSDSLGSHELQHTRFPSPFTISQSLPKFMSTVSVMPSNHLILCHPLLHLPSIFFFFFFKLYLIVLVLPNAFNLSQDQGLFQSISCSYQVTKVMELQLQHHFF